MSRDVAWEHERHQIIQGDALSVLRGMESGSVHCVVTSPPYFGLRAYHGLEWARKRAAARTEATA